MSNELRDFLALSYEELEQLNLQAKEQRKESSCCPHDSGRTPEVPDR